MIYKYPHFMDWNVTAQRREPMNNCMTIEKCKEISKKGRYVNFSSAVLSVIRRDLSSTAGRLWEFLSSETVFDSEWSVHMSVKTMATEMYRSERQVRRLLEQLVKKNYIEKIVHSGKISEIHVRLPASLEDELKHVKPRRKTSSMDKNVSSKGGFSYYIYNNNNNELTDNVEKEGVSVVDFSCESNASESYEIPSKKNEEEIFELEKRKSELVKTENEFLEKYFKKEISSLELFDKKKPISTMILNLERVINNLKKNTHHKKESKSDFFETKLISDFDKIRIDKALFRFKKPRKIVREIVFSVRRGDLGHGNVSRGISCALKLIREGRWETPVGMN